MSRVRSVPRLSGASSFRDPPAWRICLPELTAGADWSILSSTIRAAPVEGADRAAAINLYLSM